MRLSDSEECDPQKSDTDCRNADDAGGEKEHSDEQEDDIVDREDLCGLDQKPVDRLEYVVVSQEEATVSFADRILRFVDTRDEHAGEDQKNDDDHEESKDKLDRSQDGFKLQPGFVEEVLTFARGFAGQPLSPAECPFFSYESVKLTLVLGRQAIWIALSTSFELSLSFTVGFELCIGGSTQSRSRDGWSCFDQGQRQESQA